MEMSFIKVDEKWPEDTINLSYPPLVAGGLKRTESMHSFWSYPWALILYFYANQKKNFS